MNYYFDTPNFKLINKDTFKTLVKFENEIFDMIFADPPYFLSNNGITCKRRKNGNSK